MPNIQIKTNKDYSIGQFAAMACPCEILIESIDPSHIQMLTELAYQEAKRIEKKFSRYRDDNIIFKINNTHSTAINLDSETALLFDFANQCFELSEGKFDITSGILRKIWTFDGSDKIPTQAQINEIKSNIGWDKVNYNKKSITLPKNMEIDLGGVAKEYAVDSTVSLLKQHTDKSFLVNFGGDIACPKPKLNNTPWSIGVDDPKNTGKKSVAHISLYQGGLATSGDSRRFLLKDGIRYSHILDPQTGRPIPDAPHSVTVIANTCTEAGMLATFAILQGKEAETFLEAQEVKYWCIL
ncbi:FAD:protein FMN transferase [hydrothermal vent metagenome]|uniref:FAD:protein FMN transferase n=1 Tax=hydrothermal vent metagenome TaxID=652676 RepID=A0A3B0WDF1_9ZZZZ